MYLHFPYLRFPSLQIRTCVFQYLRFQRPRIHLRPVGPHFIDIGSLLSCITASLFNKLTYLLTYLLTELATGILVGVQTRWIRLFSLQLGISRTLVDTARAGMRPGYTSQHDTMQYTSIRPITSMRSETEA